jgi:hypothetical protein
VMGWVVDDVLQGLRGARVVVRRKWSVLRLADLPWLMEGLSLLLGGVDGDGACCV